MYSGSSELKPDQRKKIIDESRTVAEKEEMTQLIDRIASNSFQG